MSEGYRVCPGFDACCEQQCPERAREPLDPFAEVIDEAVPVREVLRVPVKDVGVVDRRVNSCVLRNEQSDRSEHDRHCACSFESRTSTRGPPATAVPFDTAAAHPALIRENACRSRPDAHRSSVLKSAALSPPLCKARRMPPAKQRACRSRDQQISETNPTRKRFRSMRAHVRALRAYFFGLLTPYLAISRASACRLLRPSARHVCSRFHSFSRSAL